MRPHRRSLIRRHNGQRERKALGQPAVVVYAEHSILVDCEDASFVARCDGHDARRIHPALWKCDRADFGVVGCIGCDTQLLCIAARTIKTILATGRLCDLIAAERRSTTEQTVRGGVADWLD